CAPGLGLFGPGGPVSGRGGPRRALPRRRTLTVLRRPFRLGLALPAVRPDDHDHVAAVLLGLGLDEAKFLDVCSEALKQPEPELGPGLLASPEHDRHLDLVSLPEEPLDVALLRSVIMRIDLGPELDLLDDRLGLVLAGFPGLERGLVLELAVVHELGYRWPCRGRDLDQVEVGLLGQPERITQGNDPYLLAVRADEPYLGNPDALVDTGFDADVTSLAFSSPGHPREGVPRPPRRAPFGVGCPDMRRAPQGMHAEPPDPDRLAGSEPCQPTQSRPRDRPAARAPRVPAHLVRPTRRPRADQVG